MLEEENYLERELVIKDWKLRIYVCLRQDQQVVEGLIP